MGASLRTRLLLSYIFLIVVVLAAIAVAFLVALRPIIYRQSILRLEVIQADLTPRLNTLLSNSPARVPEFIQREADTQQVRLVVVKADGSLVADSQRTARLTVPIRQLINKARGAGPFTFIDAQSVTWLYTLHALNNQTFLIAAVPQPAVQLRTVLRDDIIAPILRTGVIAILLAFLLSLAMAGWVSRPLRRLAASARALADGAYPSLRMEGPVEVQELSQAFNEMSGKVKSSQQSQRDFIANVSHELKTPITSIQGFSQAILDGTAQTLEGQQQAARVIYSESARMNRLVMDLLTLARLEAGTADLERVSVDLTALLNNITTRLSPQAQQARVALSCDLPALPPVLGDGDRLAQVFTNLVDNAIKFTPQGGQVTINALLQSNWVTVRVTDTGQGIEPQDLERIFERFYQVDRSRSGNAGRGVGLGLAIARQIILAHGGEITVESVRRQGSTFMVKLPLAATHPGV